MHKSRDLICVISFLFLAACGSGENSGSATGASAAQLNPIVAKALAEFDSAPAIESGDRRTNQYTDSEKIDASTFCDYAITESVEVKSINGTQGTFNFYRSSSPDSGNPGNCPQQHPNLVANESRVIELAEFTGFERRYIERQINPTLILERRTWLESATVLSNTEETKMGVRSQRVDLEILAKNGLRMKESVWIALDSKFLSVLEHERTYTETGDKVSIDRIISFSVRSGSLSF